ncbi:MAG: hypothetical protein HQL56_05660 [Magnetococcales bacterium]|nr:hypothetical protein [Magnetococcales bacterium]
MPKCVKSEAEIIAMLEEARQSLGKKMESRYLTGVRDALEWALGACDDDMLLVDPFAVVDGCGADTSPGTPTAVDEEDEDAAPPEQEAVGTAPEPVPHGWEVAA